MHNYRHVLFATDLGDDSATIGARSMDLARRYEARLTVLHVVEIAPLELTQEVIVSQMTALEDELKQRAETHLETLAQSLGLSPDSAQVKVGSPRYEIVNYAAENGVDLIILGKHSRKGFARLLGSTAESVVRHTACDVLTVALPRAS